MKVDGRAVAGTQVVVLAGGKAKRMGVDIPKCMLEVAGTKLIDICIQSLVSDGFKDFVFLLGHKHEMITQHIGDGSRYGINASFSIDPESVKGCGKGKAFKHALANNKIDPTKRSIIVFPDDLILVPNVYLKFLTNHIEGVDKYGINGSAILVPGTEYPYGVAQLEANSGLIRGFAEKPVIEKPTSVGIYILEPAVYKMVNATITLEDESPIELESTVLPILANAGKLGSFIIPMNSWVPINTMKEHERAGRMMERYLQVH